MTFKNAEEQISFLDGPPACSDGEMDFCTNCPRKRNCCTRIRSDGPIVPPFLFSGEVEKIARLTGLSAEQVVVAKRGEDAEEFEVLRSTEPGCIFNAGGLCQIYANRPIDCRLFPFDVHERADGRLVWVVYTDLCPVSFDYNRYFPGVKMLLRKAGLSESEVRRYSRYGKRMYNEHVIELEEVEFKK